MFRQLQDSYDRYRNSDVDKIYPSDLSDVHQHPHLALLHRLSRHHFVPTTTATAALGQRIILISHHTIPGVLVRPWMDPHHRYKHHG